MFNKIVLLLFYVLCIPIVSATLVNYENLNENNFGVDYVAKTTATVALEFYTEANNGSHFRFPECNETFKVSGWTIAEESQMIKGKLQCCRSFAINDGLTITEALQKMLQGDNFVDCAFMMHMTELLCLQKILGIHNFDAIFKCSENLYNKKIKFSLLEVNELQKLTVTHINNHKYISIGDFVYFPNIPEYGTKHRYGRNTGDNVICVGHNEQQAPLFIGFGASYKDGPKTKSQIHDIFFNDFVSPMSMSTQEHFKKCSPEALQRIHKILKLFEDREIFNQRISEQEQSFIHYQLSLKNVKLFFKEVKDKNDDTVMQLKPSITNIVNKNLSNSKSPNTTLDQPLINSSETNKNSAVNL